MAEENTIGLAMQLDVTDLKAGLKEVNKTIKDSRNEFNNATAGMEKWTKSSEGLNAKIKQLNTQLDAQEKAVEGYKAEIERVSKLEGDHSEELANLKEKLSDYETKVKSTQTQINKYSKSLEKVTEDEKKENLSVNKLSKSIKEQKEELEELKNEYASAKLDKNKTQAKELKSEIDSLTKSIEKNEKQMTKATKETKSFGDNLKDLESIGKSANKGLAIIGGAIAGVATAFFGTAIATKELRTNMEKLTVGFESSGLSAEQAKETYKELYSVVGDEGKATEATAFLGKLAKTQEELTVWTDTLTGVYAQFGDSLPIENLAEASNETAKTGKITGGLADALNWANTEGRNFGVALKEQIKFTELNEKQLSYLTEAERKEYETKKKQYEEIEEYNQKVNEAVSAEDRFQIALDNCTTEQERNKLITETLNSLYGESAEAFKESNKEVIESNKAQAKLSEKMAEVGAMAEPIINDIKEIGLQLAVALIPVVEKILPVIMDNLPMIATVLGTVAGAIITFTTAVKIATAAQALMNVVMAANPIGLIIAGITALIAIVAALAVAIVKNWDSIKAKTLEVWGAIKTFVVGVWTAIKNAWSAVGTWFTNIFTTAWNGIKTAWSGVTKFFSDLAVTIKDTFVSLPEDMLEIGQNLVKGLWNGIKDMTKWITGKLKEFAGDVLGGIKKFFGINSPSKKTAELGKYLAEGLVVGIEEGKKDVKESAKELGETFTENVSSQIDLESAIQRAIYQASNNMRTWKEWFKEITKIDDSFSNGEEAGKMFLNGLETTFSNNKTVAEMLGKQFNVAEELEKQNAQIESVLKSLFNISAKQIDETFQTTDKSVSSLVEKYKKNVAEIKRLSQDDIVQNVEVTETVDIDVPDTWLEKFAKQIEEAKAKMKELTESGGSCFSMFTEWAKKFGSQLKQLYDNVVEYQKQQTEQMVAEIDKQIEASNTYYENQIAALEKYSDDSLSVMKQKSQNELAFMKKKSQKELDSIAKLYAKELISSEEYRKRKYAIENKIASEEERLNNEQAESELKMNNEKLASTKALNEQKEASERALKIRQDELARKQFESEKANKIVTAISDSAAAIVKGFSQGGWLLGGIFAALIGASTAVQIATIANSQYYPTAFAKGGIVDHPVVGLVGEAGKEAIMPLENNTGWIKELAEKLNDFMSADINVGRRQPAYAMSGSQTVYNNYNQTINAPKMPNRRELYRDTKNLLALKRR